MLPWGMTPSEFKNLVVFKHVRGEVGKTEADFFHGHVDLPRLQMCDVDLARTLQLFQPCYQHVGPIVLREFSQTLLAIGKCAFNDQVAKIGNAIQRLPEGFTGPRIAGKYQRARPESRL